MFLKYCRIVRGIGMGSYARCERSISAAQTFYFMTTPIQWPFLQVSCVYKNSAQFCVLTYYAVCIMMLRIQVNCLEQSYLSSFISGPAKIYCYFREKLHLINGVGVLSQGKHLKELKADYLHMSPDYRHTDKHLRLALLFAALGKAEPLIS